jgi:predicted O-methyltransferase YrrM
MTAIAPVPINQVWASRAALMTSAIRTFETPIHALEIGTWYGEGSTQIWLQNLPAGSTLTLVDPWRPYGSAADMTDREFDYAAADRQVIEAYLSTIVAVRKFETAHPGRLSIDILRGDSERVLERLRDGIFDFIYVDGDHKYESVRKNLNDAKRLARPEFALICGDDLEHQPSPALLAVAREHPDRDFLRAPYHFHPGVMRAVHEEFEQVAMENGFWWVFRKDGRLTTR